MKNLCGTLIVLASILPACGQNTSDTTNNSGDSVACGTETFSSPLMTTGTVNGQDGWYVDTSYSFDESVVNLGANACRGQGVWKISNLVTSGGFGNQPISPAMTKDSGESTIRGAGGGDTFEVSFYFRSVSTVADGTTMTASISPNGGDRNSYIRFDNDDDADGGFNVWALDGAGATVSIGSNLVRGQWYKLRAVLRSVDGQGGGGVANDILEVYLDGVLAGMSSSWEEYYLSVPQAILPSNRVMFRVNNAPGLLGAFAAPQGLYIDDFKQSIYNFTAPGTIIESYATGFEVP